MTATAQKITEEKTVNGNPNGNGKTKVVPLSPEQQQQKAIDEKLLKIQEY